MHLHTIPAPDRHRRLLTSRSDTEREITETLRQIPDFSASMPDSTLARQWAESKESQLGDTVLTAREKHLMGYAVAAAIPCEYCTYFPLSATQMMGTTDRQLEAAARITSANAPKRPAARRRSRRSRGTNDVAEGRPTLAPAACPLSQETARSH